MALFRRRKIEVVAKALVAGHVGKRIGDPGKNHQVILAVKDRRDAAFPDLQERIRTARGDFQSLELDPRVCRQGDVRVFDGRGHLDVNRDDHLDVGVDVLDHAIGPLGVVDQVHVGEDHGFGGRRHVGFAGEDLAAVFRRVDDQCQVAVVPISRLLVLGVGVGMDFFAVRALVEIEVKRVFRHPAFEARSGPCRALKQRGFVIAGPGMAAGAGLADVAGEHQRQVRRAVHFRRMKPVIDAFALVNCHRLDRRDVLGQLLDHLFRRLSNLNHGVEVVVFEMRLVKRPQRWRLRSLFHPRV